ncbi:MAG TPA: MEDS domain-containing protein [Gemmatimonadales bacterium]|nr:MEDS domain-containing protein [Gemmatimonadales bacterium]
MSSWSELLDRAEPEEHFVQLYGRDDQLLTRNLTRYLAEGLRKGDALVVIATRELADAVVRNLDEESLGVSRALADGRLVLLDARATLERFLVDGQPDESLFRSVLGTVLRDTRARALTGRLRAFGEMVGLLWADGRRAEAIRLEAYWNDLLTGSGCSLFCAYPIDILDAASDVSGLDSVLGMHTHMYAGPKTMLSSGRAGG